MNINDPDYTEYDFFDDDDNSVITLWRELDYMGESYSTGVSPMIGIGAEDQGEVETRRSHPSDGKPNSSDHKSDPKTLDMSEIEDSRFITKLEEDNRLSPSTADDSDPNMVEIFEILLFADNYLEPEETSKRSPNMGKSHRIDRDDDNVILSADISSPNPICSADFFPPHPSQYQTHPSLAITQNDIKPDSSNRVTVKEQIYPIFSSLFSWIDKSKLEKNERFRQTLQASQIPRLVDAVNFFILHKYSKHEIFELGRSIGITNPTPSMCLTPIIELYDAITHQEPSTQQLAPPPAHHSQQRKRKYQT